MYYALILVFGVAISNTSALALPNQHTALTNDTKTLAALDTEYQKAVENNDTKTMARILADTFILVDGSGKSYSKTDLLKEATSGKTHYKHQVDTDQTVRIWGNTAVVTAKLWVQGTEESAPANYKMWFSDTYVRTSKGWRYVFGQSSLPLPDEQQLNK